MAKKKTADNNSEPANLGEQPAAAQIPEVRAAVFEEEDLEIQTTTVSAGKPPSKMRVIKDLLSQEPDMSPADLAARARALGTDIDQKTASVYKSNIQRKEREAAAGNTSSPRTTAARTTAVSKGNHLEQLRQIAEKVGGWAKLKELCEIMERLG